MAATAAACAKELLTVISAIEVPDIRTNLKTMSSRKMPYYLSYAL
jgi:hypothetical protein